ncbi:helix-turn-helix domain-containing protein [Streptomyces sp. NPDC056400]|uniref:telomere-protecting terminal protein Tpg n=1 Tax=Streptomyces sp. NPDC056400 TaxID=3345808 RepID=UPI0035D66EF7
MARALGDGLERLLYTRPVPATTADRLKALLRWERGSTRRVAVILGVSQRTVQRWVTRKPGSQGRPSPRHEQKIAELVRARWQPLIRARRRAAAEEGGVVVHTRARFGFKAGPASSDDPRMRCITGRLNPTAKHRFRDRAQPAKRHLVSAPQPGDHFHVGQHAAPAHFSSAESQLT